jgi:hypothetical protein
MQHQHPQTRPHAASGNSRQAPPSKAMYSPPIERPVQKATLSGDAK